MQLLFCTYILTRIEMFGRTLHSVIPFYEYILQSLLPHRISYVQVTESEFVASLNLFEMYFIRLFYYFLEIMYIFRAPTITFSETKRTSRLPYIIVRITYYYDITYVLGSTRVKRVFYRTRIRKRTRRRVAY